MVALRCSNTCTFMCRVWMTTVLFFCVVVVFVCQYFSRRAMATVKWCESSQPGRELLILSTWLYKPGKIHYCFHPWPDLCNACWHMRFKRELMCPPKGALPDSCNRVWCSFSQLKYNRPVKKLSSRANMAMTDGIWVSVWRSDDYSLKKG